MNHIISVAASTDRQVKDTKSIPFGTQPTEHMFIAEYAEGNWHNSRIVPFDNLTLSPMALCLHYGQTVFEGMKAFVMDDRKISIFRPDRHYERFTVSLKRMCMPEVPRTLFMEALCQLVQLDASWIPADIDGALYIRPFMIATEERIGLRISEKYLFMIICSPVYNYYTRPLKVKIESTYSRSAEGGTGFAKCGGNYAGAFFPSHLAHQSGYDQVLWTDSKHHEFIEESGTMNIMFNINGTLITPPLSSSILDGITRNSVLTLARDMNILIKERHISYRELQHQLEAGHKVEAFGTGTAAVIAPIETIAIGRKQYSCYTGSDALMYQLQARLLNIRKGIVPDTNGWNYIL